MSAMARHSRLPLLTAAVLLLVGTSSASRLSAQAGPAADYRAAVDLWEAGRYHDALPRLLAVLRSPASADYLERIALLTGEWYPSTAIADDGRLPRLSPSGQFVSYEVGPAADPTTRIVRAAATLGLSRAMLHKRLRAVRGRG